jgi:hypothetical protein
VTIDDKPFTYEHLAPEAQRQIIDQRLQQYEAEHYGYTLNRMTLEQAVDVSPEEKREQLDLIDRRIASLETSIALHRAERDRHRS